VLNGSNMSVPRPTVRHDGYVDSPVSKGKVFKLEGFRKPELGEAVGKGLGGGSIIPGPPSIGSFPPNSVADPGNVCIF
jgi:hypothetical protein